MTGHQSWETQPSLVSAYSASSLTCYLWFSITCCIVTQLPTAMCQSTLTVMHDCFSADGWQLFSRYMYLDIPHTSESGCKDTSWRNFFLLLARRSLSIERKHYWNKHVTYPICRSVCQSVCPEVYCGKTADWIRMPFGIVSGVGRGMGVLDGVVIIRGEGAVFEWIWGILL